MTSVILSFWLLCPVQAPRYRIDNAPTITGPWEQVNVISNNVTLIAVCEKKIAEFWRILPLAEN